MYTEGYLIDIVEEGSWKDAKVEGSQTSEKVIVMRKILIIKDKIDRILRFETQETDELKIGEYYNIFYENNKIKEIYQNKDLINKMQSEDNIIADKKNNNLFEVIIFIVFFVVLMITIGSILISFPILLILKYLVLSDVDFNSFLNNYIEPMTFCSTIISFIFVYLLDNKWVKDENEENNKLIEDFRNEIEQGLKERINIKNTEKNKINK